MDQRQWRVGMKEALSMEKDSIGVSQGLGRAVSDSFTQYLQLIKLISVSISFSTSALEINRFLRWKGFSQIQLDDSLFLGGSLRVDTLLIFIDFQNAVISQLEVLTMQGLNFLLLSSLKLHRLILHWGWDGLQRRSSQFKLRLAIPGCECILVGILKGLDLSKGLSFGQLTFITMKIGPLFLTTYQILHRWGGVIIIILMSIKGFLSGLSKFSISGSPVIPHFRINLPFPKKNLEECLQTVTKLRSKNTPAIFVSINGITENTEDCQLLHDAFKYTSERERIRVFAFLQENISALSYFVGSSATHISANPFCSIGDLTAPHKSYINLEKLMNYFGIEYERLGTKQNLLWNEMNGPSQFEQKFTEKYLAIVKENIKSSIKVRRNLSDETVDNFDGKVFHPKEALDLKLIDSIGTLEQFKQVNFPNNKLKNYAYVPNRRQPDFNRKEVDVIQQLADIIEMPKVSLLSMQDPTHQCIQNFLQIIAVRMQNPESLEDLDWVAGKILSQMQIKLTQDQLMF